MFDKRLLALAPETKVPIALSVALQWGALAANIALFLMIGSIFGRMVEGTLDDAALFALLLPAAGLIAARFVCQALAASLSARAAGMAKRRIRQEVYDKLVRLGSGYVEHAKTASAVQICVEGVEQMEAYFGSYIPQLFYAALAPVTLFFALAALSLPAAVVLIACVPLIPLRSSRCKRRPSASWEAIGVPTPIWARRFWKTSRALPRSRCFRPTSARMKP